MAIEVLEDYNAQASCCCPQILCPIIEQICESMSRTSFCSDDDYTDALAEFEAHEAWIAEHDAWVIAHAAWVTAHADWVSCEALTPGECGVEPEEPIEPVEPPDTPEPTKPAGYDDVEHGCYGPYEQPAGDITEKIPLIYRTWDRVTRTAVYDGEGFAKESISFPPDSFESLSHVIYVAGVATVMEGESNSWDGTTCTNTPTTGLSFINPAFLTYTYVGETCDLTPSTRTFTNNGQSVEGTVPLTLQGCPGPFPGTGFEEAWDFTETNDVVDTLGDSISELDLVTRAEGKIPDTWPAAPEGATCEASSVTEWPTVADLMTDEAWPSCADFAGSPLAASATGTATAVRYRWRIPSTWTDPVTGATVAFPGTHFKVVWDVINEPDGWDTGGTPRSWYSEDLEATWTGPGSGDQDDPSWYAEEGTYFYINAPTSFVGRRYVVNVRFVCREDWGIGILPQVIGEAVTLPDPE